MIILCITHCIILWKFSSGVGGSFLPTSPEVFFLPPPGADGKPVDKLALQLRQLAKLRDGHARILAGGVNHPLVSVLNGDGDEALVPEGCDVGADLAVADLEEVGEILIGSEATALVIEGVNFDEQHLLHERQRRRQPNFFGNPDAFEISTGTSHV